MSASIKSGSVILSLLLLLLPAPLLAEILTIPGTGDGTSVLSALAAAFNKQNPDIQVEFPKSIGSSGGVEAAGKGEAVLARVARNIKPDEEKYGLSYQPFAKVPAVFFTTNDLKVNHLSSQQICAIYSGAISNWKEIGGPDLPIRVVRREDGDSTLKVLRKSIPGFDQVKITDNALMAKKTPELFAIMSAENHAIGFGPYDLAKNSGMQIVSIDGRAPSFPGYPSFTTLAFVYQKKNLTPAAKKFIDFATSSAANLPISVSGGVSVQ